MVMEVLLMSDVADLGAEGDIIKVADGYARNYLFPKKLGAPVTVATKRRLEKIKRDRDSTSMAKLAAANELAKKLQKVSCTIPAKVGNDEQLYGSITAKDIMNALVSQGFEGIDKHQLLLEKPIKELGVFNVQISLHPEVETTIKVWIVEE